MEPEEENSITPETKMNFMIDIVLHFLRNVSQYAPLLLVIVKHQFMSKQDWFLTHAVCKKIKSGELKNVSFMIAGWPQRNKSYSNRYSHRDAAMCYQTFREEYCELDETVILGGNEMRQSALYDNEKLYNSDTDKAITVELPRWTKSEVEEFLKIEFDIKRCSPMLVKFVHNKTGGIPAMCKALVRDHHLVFVKNGGQLDCSSVEKLGDLALGFKETDIHFPIPASIQSYFAKMMDSLNDYNNSQFILITLKTASLICIGQEFQSLAFALDTLRACHPLFNNSDDYFNDEFDEAIDILVFEGFIREGSFEEERPQFFRPNAAVQKNFYYQGSHHERSKTLHQRPSFYVFCSGFARDVIYNVMLFKQRSELHKQVSEVLKKYDELLSQSNMANSEVRNSLRRHETLLQFDGMKSSFEIEEEQKLNQQFQFNRQGSFNNARHRFVDSQQLYNQGTVLGMTMGPMGPIGVTPSGMSEATSLLTPIDTIFHDNSMMSMDEYDMPSPYADANGPYSRVPPSVLVVYLKTAKNIPHLDAWQIPNLYVTFHYGNGKEQHLSRSVITSNSDDNDDPIWNEYAAIPLSTELLVSDVEQRLTLKFWDYSPIRPDDDVMIGKIYVDLNDLYEEQIKQHRHLEHKLRTPRNSVAAINYHSGLKKQLEDRDYIYVDKSLKMIVDDDLKQCVPNSKQSSIFEAMFKFCVLPGTGKHDQMNSSNDLIKGGRSMSTSEIMKKMNQKFHHQTQMSQFSAISGISSHISQDSQSGLISSLNHMPQMSNVNPSTFANMNNSNHPNDGGIGGGGIQQINPQQFPMRPHIPYHMQQSTGLDKYVSQLKHIKQSKNIPPNKQPILQSNFANHQNNNYGRSNRSMRSNNNHYGTKPRTNTATTDNPPLLQNYSEDDSYFLMQLENEEMIDYQESQDFDNMKFNLNLQD